MENKENKPKIQWKNVLVGTVPGIVLGTAAGVAFAHDSSEVIENEQVGEVIIHPEDIYVPETQADLATGVNDSMSFGEAFAAARQELGAGGAFEWHGNLYSTYTAEEWEAMTPEQRDDYAQSVAELTPVADVHESTPVTEDVSDVVSENDDDVVIDPEDEMVTIDSETIGIEVHDVGTVETLDGEVDVAIATIDGHDAILVDHDQDGFVDEIVIDMNDNGEIDEDEVMDTSNTDLHLADVSDIAYNEPENDIYSGPDYTNDGDVTSLV